jgi:hypothetical protein
MGKYTKWIKAAYRYYNDEVRNYIPDADDIIGTVIDFMENEGHTLTDEDIRQIEKEVGVNEQTGAGAAGGTTTATFQPAVGPAGSPSKSGAFPGTELKRKKKKINEKIEGAVDFYGRIKGSSVKEK